MKFSNKTKAFTLSEVLFALVVVGIIAGLTIPHFATGINGKMLSAQTKKAFVSIQDSFEQFMMDHNMQRLDSRNVTYNPYEIFASSSNREEDTFPDTLVYKNLAGGDFTIEKTNRMFALCDNGMTMMYGVIAQEGNNACYGEMLFDVNGSERPNVAGRDLHSVYITRKGHLVDYEKCKALNNSEDDDVDENAPENETEKEKLLRYCINASGVTQLSTCATLMQMNNWTMDY